MKFLVRCMIVKSRQEAGTIHLHRRAWSNLISEILWVHPDGTVYELTWGQYRRIMTSDVTLADLEAIVFG